MKKLIYAFILGIVLSFLLQAQDETPHTYTKICEVPYTSVKNQGRAGTCWCFATMSFLESEILRIKQGEYDLSEMFVVRHTQPMKAKKYVRYHGNASFGDGGQAHDLFYVLKNYGIVPEKVYNGLQLGDTIHNHGELTEVLQSMLNAVVAKKGGKITSVWDKAFESVMDIYLGKIPDEFEYNGKKFTPKSFLQGLEINPNDYVELTSFNHHPFYESFILEIPDNWMDFYYYNVPLDELIQIIDYALENGYSVAWDGDVSEKTFSWKKGYAVFPVNEKEDGKTPEKELNVTQELRQEGFDNLTTTDDHLMHFVGIYENQEGTKFYLTKNSWGLTGKHNGFLYISEPFVKMKTIAIMVHKDAIPKEIRNKLKL
ncbi:MAG: aminopeptidase [Ignavibacteriales bacterium]|nr:aminopeptidase [Ignavibacteriales bacterium]